MKKFKCSCGHESYKFTQTETYPEVYSEPVELGWEIRATPEYVAFAKCLGCERAWGSIVSIEELNSIMTAEGVLL